MMKYLSRIEKTELDTTLKEFCDFKAIVALLPESEKSSVSLLQSSCQAHRLVLAGGIFPALLHEGIFVTEGVWLLGIKEEPFISIYETLPDNELEIDKLTDSIPSVLNAHLDKSETTLFMIFDAMVPNIATILDSIYLKLGNRVHYAGANAGSETFQPMPCLFNTDKIVSGGLLLILLKNHQGAVLEHGYHAPGNTVYATSLQGNRISQIDWEPAFSVYKKLVNSQYGVEINRDNFYQLAVHFPFGIIRANNNIVVRIPVILGEDDSLFCVGEIPPNSVLTLLQSPSVDSGETLKVLLEGLEELKVMPVKELCLFYCAGRRMHLGLDAATKELGELTKQANCQIIAGALSLGEIGNSMKHNYPLFHNATLVATCWPTDGT